MKCAFQGVRNIWFLRVEARTSSKCFGPYLLGSVAENNDHVSNISDISDPLEVENSFTSTEKSNTKVYQEIELQCHKSPLEERRHICVSKKKKREKKDCFLDYKANENETKSVGSGVQTVVLTAQTNSDHSASVQEDEPRYQQASRSMTDAPSEVFSEVKSVTSIIRRYFQDSNEITNFSSPASSDVTSKIRKRRKKRLKAKADKICSSIQVDSFPNFAGQRPSNMLPFRLPNGPSKRILEGKINGPQVGKRILKGKINGPEVGKRLLTASHYLVCSASKKKSAIYFCRSRDRKVQGLDSSLVKWSVFEISDTDD